MATFKAGQRVKHVAGLRPEDAHGKVADGGPVGDEGVVLATQSYWDLQGADYVVLFDNDRSDHSSGGFAMHAYQLAPLTDPKADAFVESMKRMKPYEEPKVEERIAVLSGRTKT